jgi:hypothetical protein
MTPEDAVGLMDVALGFGFAGLEVGAAFLGLWLVGHGPEGVDRIRDRWRRRPRPGYGWPRAVKLKDR